MNLSKDLYSKKNNIFQSSEWLEFQKSVGRDSVEIDGAYFYRSDLIKGRDYLFAPKGGSLEYQVSSIKNQVTGKAVFVRVEPSGSAVVSITVAQGWRPVTRRSLLSQQYSPKQTLVMDLTKTEEDLLSNMKSKHRYNIRLAEKKDVKIKLGYSKEDVTNFYALSQEVAKRDSTFSSHGLDYYQKMAETLGPKENLLIFTAFFNDEPISSILVLFYNETAIYLHGASANSHRELMPNHLVQWTAIKEAKKRGCKYYDFWGISVKQTPTTSGSHPEVTDWEVDEKHAWAGITKFKLGFVSLEQTGEIIEFSGAYDLILKPFSYRILCLGNTLRKLLK